MTREWVSDGGEMRMPRPVDEAYVHSGEVTIRAVPFDAIELGLGALCG